MPETDTTRLTTFRCTRVYIVSIEDSDVVEAYCTENDISFGDLIDSATRCVDAGNEESSLTLVKVVEMQNTYDETTAEVIDTEEYVLYYWEPTSDMQPENEFVSHVMTVKYYATEEDVEID